jgi:hypothetical protein
VPDIYKYVDIGKSVLCVCMRRTLALNKDDFPFMLASSAFNEAMENVLEKQFLDNMNQNLKCYVE